MIGRGRLVSHFVLALLVASALPVAIVPTASAVAATTGPDAPVSTLALKAQAPGGTAHTVVAGEVLAIGTQLWWAGTVTANCTNPGTSVAGGPPTGGDGAIQATVSLDTASTTAATNIQAGAAPVSPLQTVSQTWSGNKLSLTIDTSTTAANKITVTAKTTAGAYDGASVPLTVSTKIQCATANQAQAFTQQDPNGATVTQAFAVGIDQVRPTVTPTATTHGDCDPGQTCAAHVDPDGRGVFANERYHVEAPLVESTGVTWTAWLNDSNNANLKTITDTTATNKSAWFSYPPPPGMQPTLATLVVKGFDTAGNLFSSAVTVDSVWISNSTPAGPTVGASKLIRTAPSLDGTVAGTQQVDLGYTPTTGVQYAQVTIGSNTPRVVSPTAHVSATVPLGGSDPSGVSSVVVNSVDNAGALSTASVPLTFPSLTTIRFGSDSSLRRAGSGTNLGTLSFSAANAADVELAIHSDNTNVANAPAGWLKTGKPGSAAGDWDTTATTDPASPGDLRNVPITSGVGSINLGTTASQVLALPDGFYTFRLIATSASTPAMTTIYNFAMSMDQGKPTVVALPGATGGTASTLSAAVHNGDGAPLQLGLKVQDPLSGIAQVKIQAFRPDGNPAYFAQTNPPALAQWVLSPADCAPNGALLAAGLCDSTHFGTDVNVPRFGFDLHTLQGVVPIAAQDYQTHSIYGNNCPCVLPVGNYSINVTATDIAGNPSDLDTVFQGDSTGGWFTVGPRVALFVNQTLPFAFGNPNAGLDAIVLAARDATLPASGVDAGCEQGTGTSSSAKEYCAVDRVAIYIRDATATDGDGSFVVAKTQPSATHVADQDATTTEYQPLATSVKEAFWTYARTSSTYYPFPANSGLDASKPMVMRAAATVSTPFGDVTSYSDWIPVGSATTGALNVVSPPREGLIHSTTSAEIAAGLPFTDAAPDATLNSVTVDATLPGENLSSPGVTTTITGADISDTATSVQVASTSAFPATGTLLIGDEYVTYSATSATGFTLSGRGQHNTIASIHAVGALVSLGNLQSTLSGTGSADPITVTSTAGFPNAGKLIVDREIFAYTGTTATTFTGVTRFGGAHVQHDPGALVSLYAYVANGVPGTLLLSHAADLPPNGGTIVIDSEVFQYTSRAGNQLSGVTSSSGTVGDHVIGAPVKLRLTLARQADVTDSTPSYTPYNGTLDFSADPTPGVISLDYHLLKRTSTTAPFEIAAVKSAHFTYVPTGVRVDIDRTVVDADKHQIAASGAGAAVPCDTLPCTSTSASVLPVFDLNFTIAHGATGAKATDITFALQRSETVAGATSTITPPTDGFAASVVQPNLVADPATFTAHITMPASASDGQVFTLLTSVKTNGSNWDAPSDFSNATSRIKVTLDKSAPVAAVDQTATNSTGLLNGATPELQFLGTAKELGTLSRLDVRVYDVTHNLTLEFTPPNNVANSWIRGLNDSWGSSVARTKGVGPNAITFKDVVLTAPTDGSGLYTWAIHTGTDGTTANPSTRPYTTSEALPVNRTSIYRLDVRAWDALGHFSEIDNVPVTFDPTPPTPIGPPFVTCKPGNTATTTDSCGNPITVNYHGLSSANADARAHFIVIAYDDNCMAGVSLVGIAPDNSTVGPFPMKLVDTGATDPNGVPTTVSPRPADDPTCPGAYRVRQSDGATASKLQWWLDTREVPAATDQAGKYVYWPVATDIVGNVNASASSGAATLVNVLDTQPAQLRGQPVVVEGATVPAGSLATIHADVIEATGIDHVDLLAFRINGSQVTKIGEANMHATSNVAKNGTGTWELTTGDLGITLDQGNYTFQVVPYDTNWQTDCVQHAGSAPDCSLYGNSVTMAVAQAAEVTFGQISPKGSYIGGSSSLVFSVVGKAITNTSISVTAGPKGAALDSVTPTLAPITGGYSVTLKPNLTGLTNYSVQVSALSRSQTFGFEIDRVGPVVAFNVSNVLPANNLSWIGPNSRISINASDNQSGSPVVTYAIDGGAATNYSAPFAPTGADGNWTIAWTATDAVGNPTTGTATYTLDKTPPALSIVSAGDDMVITAQDDGVGLVNSSLLIHYGYGTSPLTSTKAFEHQLGNLWHAQLGGNASQTGLKYWIEGKDLLGNGATNYTAGSPGVIRANGGSSCDASDPTCQINNGTGQNQTTDLPPTVSITAPVEGSQLHAGDPLTLRFSASDPEKANVTITAHLLGPSSLDRSLLVSEPSDGVVPVNTSGLAVGSYAITVSANDGSQASDIARVTFSIVAAGGTKIVSAPPTSGTTGQAVGFAVSFNASGKKIAAATFTVEKDGKPFTAGTLKPGATSYTGTYTPTSAGTYTVKTTALYTDSTSDSATVGATRISGSAPTATSGVSVPFVAVLAIASVTAALAGYGAFGRWRK